MRSQVVVSLYFLSAAAVWAAPADPRAVEECKKEGAFTQIAACLPDADVSFKTLDAFEKIYPASALPLKTKCLELNKGAILPSTACVTNAIEDAIALKASLPEGTDLGDAVFDAVSDKSLSQKLDASISTAQSAYPDKMIWGGTIYQKYK